MGLGRARPQPKGAFAQGEGLRAGAALDPGFFAGVDRAVTAVVARTCIVGWAKRGPAEAGKEGVPTTCGGAVDTARDAPLPTLRLLNIRNIREEVVDIIGAQIAVAELGKHT